MKPTNRTLTAALALTLALGLAACGTDDTPSVSTAGQAADEALDEATADSSTDDTTDDESTDDDAAEETTGDDSAAATDAGTSDDLTAAALAAIATAEAEAGGTAYEIDDQDDDGTWEIDVRVGDRSVEVTVSADGTTVVETEDNDDLDSDDLAALDAATITLTEAIEIAINEVGGILDDAELESDDGEQGWDVTVDTDAKDDVDVLVSVTGEVITVDN